MKERPVQDYVHSAMPPVTALLPPPPSMQQPLGLISYFLPKTSLSVYKP